MTAKPRTPLARDLEGWKPCTPKEDRILLGMCVAVFTLTIAAIWLVVHYAAQIDELWRMR